MEDLKRSIKKSVEGVMKKVDGPAAAGGSTEYPIEALFPEYDPVKER